MPIIMGAWGLARLYPEVLDAHAQFGGDLEDMLHEYHRQVLLCTDTAQVQSMPDEANVNENGAKGG